MDPGVARRGLGLLGARERAAALGGTLAVASAPGRGCRLLLTLPLAKPQQRPAEAPAP
jgi:two-component system sensor histidine kinase UhpB